MTDRNSGVLSGSVSGFRGGPSAASRAGVRRHRRTGSLREALIFCALILPNALVIGAFVYRPLVLNIYYSTLDWRLGSTVARVVGLANYVEWATDPASIATLKITAIFAVTTVGGSMVIGLLLALALNTRIKGIGFVRPAVFAPYVLSGVGVGLVWLFIFNPNQGALVGVLQLLGLDSPPWYRSGGWALAMVIIVYVWQHLGYAAIIYLAGLQAIPQSLLDAAAMDGATGVARLREVVLPLLSPTTFFLLITISLNSLRQFDLIKIMTDGGPLNSTTTLMFQVYEEAFVNFRAGYSATVATVLFVILFVVAAINLLVVERKVYYS